MISMTGFGRKEVKLKSGTVVIEAKSENHRYLDVTYQLPDSLSSLESKIQDIVRSTISRGKFRIGISVKLNSLSGSLNTGLARETLMLLNKLRKELKLDGTISLDQLLTMKDLYTKETKDEFTAKDIAKISNALREVIMRVHKARKEEGILLRKDLNKRISKLERIIGRIQNKRKNFSRDNRDKLKDRLGNLLEDTQLDKARLLQEIAILAERSDFTEEVVRLNAHIKRFKDTMGRNGSIGRELDFLIQEMNRESGTISAKSKDARISHLTIELRSELEKMREQVQNIE